MRLKSLIAAARRKVSPKKEQPSGAKKSLGKEGEEQAARYLEKKGYRVLKRNFRCPVGEIDIIAKDGRAFVFVEVKTRAEDLFGLPEEAVDTRKQKKMKQAALYYLMRLKKEPPARFDIISISVDQRGQGRRSIEHIRDAFEV